MSYYILPKINNTIIVKPQYDISNEKFKTYISHSLLNYYNETIQQIKNICVSETDISYNTVDELIKIVNPHEYIFTKIPGYKYSISKIKTKTSLFYDFLEVIITLNILHSFKINNIKSLHFSPNSSDTIDCLEMLRENFKDENNFYNEINNEIIKLINDNKYDFLFFEAKSSSNLKEYIISLIQIILIIINNQEINGISIIKINHIFHKPVLDILYILSSLYDKTYILKTNTSNITTFDKFIICKNFQMNQSNLKYNKINYCNLVFFLHNLNNLNKEEKVNITSILDFEIPYYFTTKIDDINVIIGQQQLESLDMVLNIIKNKNKDDKIETIKKTNVQKSVAWCEKYKIPHNKFTEKINIFLPIINEES